MSENTPQDTPPPATDPMTGAVPAPAPAAGPSPMLESDARMWAMLVHIGAAAALLLSGGFLAFVAPLVVWLIFRERSALVDFHGKQNLNLQLTMLVVAIAAVVIGVATFGIGFFVTGPLWLIYGIYAFVISIVAGVKANRGEYFGIPIIIPFVR